jgi:ATP-binding protein involved in chromosome partitioning
MGSIFRSTCLYPERIFRTLNNSREREIGIMVKIQEKMSEPDKHKKAQADQDASVTASLGKIKNKFLVMSGKGGVGKTSTAVNLAVALSNKGFSVGIMDVDLHGPDVPRMLGLSGMLDLNSHQKLNPMKYSENLSAVSIESLTPSKDEAIIWRGPIKFSAIKQFIGDVEWGDLDYLIIDAPPGTGDEPLTVAQIVPDARAVIVTTPQEVSLADVRKSINFCKTVKMEIVGLVENMSGFSCPHCHEAIDMFGVGGGEKTAKDAEINFLGRIPLDPKIVACGDSGKSIFKVDAESPVAKAFGGVADSISRLSN